MSDTLAVDPIDGTQLRGRVPSQNSPERRWRPTSDGRILPLQGLRAVAFLLVFVHHAMKVPMLWWGVDLFFVLSGFLITTILLTTTGRPDFFSRFYLRRALRILPPYLLILTIAFTFFDGRSADRWWYVLFLSNVMHSFSLGSGYEVLAPMWSLAVEEQFYLIWPIVVCLVPRRLFWIAPVVAIALAPIVRVIASRAVNTHWMAYEMLPSRMDTLAIGGLLAALRLYSLSAFAKIARAVPFILAGAGISFATLYHALPDFRTQANSMSFNVLGYTLLAIAAGCVICYAVALSEASLLYRIMTAPALLYLGSISFMMYLCHMLALTAATSLTTSRFSAAILGLAATVMFASISWRIMERPLLRLKDSALRYAPLRG